MCLLFSGHVRRIPLGWNPIRTSALKLISSDKAHRDTSENESSLMHFFTDRGAKRRGGEKMVGEWRNEEMRGLLFDRTLN